MARFLALILASAALWGQRSVPGEKPPAKVDTALRARITAFYKAYVDGRFRDAETIVATDTKNFFYAAAKPQFLGFEIQSIRYSDKFTRATVLTACRQQLMIPGFADGPVPIPVTSTWKLEKGKWYWYVDQSALQDTPFGKMAAPTGRDAGTPPLPASLPTTPDFALHKVSADKQKLTLKAGGSVEVTVANSALGVMGVRVHGMPVGVEVTPARADLAREGKATFTVKALQEAQAGTLTFTVEQTGETIEIRVVIE